MPGWDYDWSHHGGTGWLGALLMTITMIVFWGGLITVAVILVRRLGQKGTDHGGGARRILDERFARGEIDHDEYERHLQALRAGR